MRPRTIRSTSSLVIPRDDLELWTSQGRSLRGKWSLPELRGNGIRPPSGDDCPAGGAGGGRRGQTVLNRRVGLWLATYVHGAEHRPSLLRGREVGAVDGRAAGGWRRSLPTTSGPTCTDGRRQPGTARRPRLLHLRGGPGRRRGHGADPPRPPSGGALPGRLPGLPGRRTRGCRPGGGGERTVDGAGHEGYPAAAPSRWRCPAGGGSRPSPPGVAGREVAYARPAWRRSAGDAVRRRTARRVCSGAPGVSRPVDGLVSAARTSGFSIRR